MSRSADRTAATAVPPDERRDGGFTLIEIMVALGIVVAVMTAALPQVVVGIRSGETSRQVTQAKGVGQGQLERMRNLPYHVAPAAGDYRDVLDYYYRNLAAPTTAVGCTDADGLATPKTTWTGYVSSSGTRCSYEPVTGPFYRYVVPHPATGTDPDRGFWTVVDTQFLSAPTSTGGSTVLTPPAGYNTQTAGADSPVSSQIAVTVTVLYERRGTTKPVTTYTQIADQPVTTSRIDASATATAVEVGSVTTADGAVSLEGGLLNLTGSLDFGSTAGASLAAASGGLATGEQGGVSATVEAPSTATTRPAATGGLTGGCALACWGTGQLDLGPVTATSGLPNAGTAASPMQSRITDKATNAGLSFHNSLPGQYRPGLGLSGPLVRLDPSATATTSGVTADCRISGTGSTAYLRSAGFLSSTPMSDTTPTVEACATSSASRISLFPTTFAPRGVLQVELQAATARCVVSGAGHTAQAPSYDYKVIVRRHRPASGSNPEDPDAYDDVLTITPSSTTDGLAALDLTTIPVGGGHVLGDYVASWSALVPSDVDTVGVNGVSSVRVPGVLKVTSRPVRLLDGAPDGDPASAVSVTLGEVGCSALDAR